ncbi:putative Trypsin/Subtilisin-like serine protease [Vibrio nigripulchritudo MADA3029]|nr:putative Trypsin/Subtilisin-like serine protease [Vibrio nigripulchritudo MADA3020]CCN51902.1 putative Trypsin/Subtilisin-like serine protease [Vibrio nigripulchritudo MADA3021]CCN60273.1 putative Trypsin/Subtilisin-like serine protease [Vibrio nigripulchritudo MADA3029]
MKITRNMALVTAMLAPMATIGAEIPGAGFEVTPRIVGGGDANTANWGFFSHLQIKIGNKTYSCGGSNLGDGYVLTAAHCVDGALASGVSVRVGAKTRRGNDGQRANVTQIHMHPNYNSSTYKNDIAVLKLDRVLPTATTVEIAAGSLSQYAGIGDLLSVAGLGRLSSGGASPSRLQEVDVPLVSDATCRAAGGPYNNVGSVEFCAGLPQGGKDSCQGDSGGPIVVNRSGTITQLGVVSWGIGCAAAGNYGVYSDIAALRGWLDTVISAPGGNYSVGYTKDQSLASFKVGETKSHTFSIKNTGTEAFTLNTVSVAGSGVASSPVIGADNCSQSTLTANQSCQVSVEFGASAAGTAKAQLSFSTDKGTSVYTANVSAEATTTGGGNGGTYDFVYPEGISNYTFGTVVLAEDGNRYQCLGFPGGLWCSAGGAYAPGTGWAWDSAWSKL